MPPKKTAGGGKMTKEEERLLLESSRHVTKTTSALFYGNAFIIAALPLWLFWRVQMMDLVTYAILFVALTILNTWLIAFSYRKTKVALKHKISLKRDAAVSKEVVAELNASGKKLTKAEKDERISWKRNEVADAEATTFSIFYNNTFYLFLVFLLYYFLRSFHPAMYPTTITHDPSLYKPIPPIFGMFSWGSGLVPSYPKVR